MSILIKPTPKAPQPEPSTILGKPLEDVKSHYKVGKELGRGQFGVTCSCTEIGTNNPYACKSILKRKLVSKNDKDDMKLEVHTMGSKLCKLMVLINQID
ncbi:Calcium-dependent protein kinase 21 [Castilleja foliolosa]|uniref:Calcium-dependent protein kinase 21 n=1 Tax=Castilleja foliolosa TaxID=1961234 RepID=A0ABD3EJ88_9LAMI